MSHKVKSSLYFASLLLALVTYYNINSVDTIQNTELAENTVEQVSAERTLN